MRRNPAFSPFLTTVGTNGTLTMSLVDANTSQIACLRAGNGYKRHPFRFFAKMPEREEAERFPSPLSYDRSTVTFVPTLLVLDQPLPPHFTAGFTRVVTLKGDLGKLTKTAIHCWRPELESHLFPAARIECSSLRPGETVEFEGVSYWYNSTTKMRGARARDGFLSRAPSERPPSTEMRQAVSLRLFITMSWLPLHVDNRGFQVVQGDPLHHASPAPVSTPWAPAPTFEPYAPPLESGNKGPRRPTTPRYAPPTTPTPPAPTSSAWNLPDDFVDPSAEDDGA